MVTRGNRRAQGSQGAALRLRRVAGVVIGLLCVAALLGCAKATVWGLRAPLRGAVLPKPDRVLVRPFAVSSADVQLDRGAIPSVKRREMTGRELTREEASVGKAVADAMAEHLVAELRKVGILAELAPPHPSITSTTAVVLGQFLTVDEGDRTKRLLVGFGLGGSELLAAFQVYQNNVLVAEAHVSTTSSLKPGILPTLGGGAVAGRAATAAVAGTMTSAANEKFAATVDADAKRAARAIAKEIAGAYVQRGWLPAEALR